MEVVFDLLLPACVLHALAACDVALRREEREQRRADIEHLAGSLVNKVNECVAAIDEGEHATVAAWPCAGCMACGYMSGCVQGHGSCGSAHAASCMWDFNASNGGHWRHDATCKRQGNANKLTRHACHVVPTTMQLSVG